MTMARRKTQPETPIEDDNIPQGEPTTEYIVIESYTANINNKPLKATKGERVHLTPTQYAVLKRFVV